MVKKTYCPFKMWGSYVGAVLFTIIYTWSVEEPIFALLTLVPLISGFLIGWGIHSLIRRIRK